MSQGLESKEHYLLKEKAKKMLLTNGFKEKEIYSEYKIIDAKNNRLKYIVDVVGQSKDKLIFIECGKTRKGKLEELRGLCTKLFHLKYSKKHIFLLSMSKELYKKLRFLSIDEKKSMNELINNSIEEKIGKEDK